MSLYLVLKTRSRMSGYVSLATIKRKAFNTHGAVLFYEMSSDQTLKCKNEKSTGGLFIISTLKRALVLEVTILVYANMNGSEKFKLLVIGKCQNPKCFKMLLFQYKTNRKARVIQARRDSEVG